MSFGHACTPLARPKVQEPPVKHSETPAAVDHDQWSCNGKNQWRIAMFKFIDGLPHDVLAIEAVGKVSHEDYKSTLIPRAEAMMGKGPIKMLYVIGKEFTGFEVGALWDDSAFGLRHWHDFSHIAVVTDHAWLRVMVGMLKPLFHGEVRLFSLAEMPTARRWITDSKRVGP